MCKYESQLNIIGVRVIQRRRREQKKIVFFPLTRSRFAKELLYCFPVVRVKLFNRKSVCKYFNKENKLLSKQKSRKGRTND